MNKILSVNVSDTRTESINMITKYILDNDYIIIDGIASESFMKEYYPTPRLPKEVVVLMIGSPNEIVRIVKKNNLIKILKSQKYTFDANNPPIILNEKTAHVENLDIKYDNTVMVTITKKISYKNYDILSAHGGNKEDKELILKHYIDMRNLDGK